MGDVALGPRMELPMRNMVVPRQARDVGDRTRQG